MSHQPRPPDPQLTPGIIARLLEGVTTAYVAQELGIGLRAAGRVLRAYGCPYYNGKWSTLREVKGNQ